MGDSSVPPQLAACGARACLAPTAPPPLLLAPMAQPLSLPGTHSTTVPGSHGTITATACHPWHQHHSRLAPTAQPLPLPGTNSMGAVLGTHSATTAPAGHHSTATALPTPAPAGCPAAPAVVTEHLVAQPQGTPAGAACIVPPESCGHSAVLGLVPLGFAAEAALAWQGHPQGDIPSVPGLGWALQGGSTLEAGCTPGTTGTSPAPAAPQRATHATGHCGRGCRSSLSKPLPGPSRSPGVIFGSASLPS